MKKLLVWIGAVTVLALLGAHGVSADVNDFTIKSFDAQYHLTRDEEKVSQLRVVETIVAEFPDFDQNHGIERAIPETYKDQRLNLSIKSVQRADGSDWNYETYTTNDNLVVRIGNEDEYVHGQQTYVITYTMRDVVSTEDSYSMRHTDRSVTSGQEWYWNVNGTQWSQPFEKVSATLHIPKDLSGALKADTFCYTGALGSREANCRVTREEADDGVKITIVATQPLQANENMSFVTTFAPGTFEKWELDQGWIAASIISGAAIPVVMFIAMWRKWSRSGRDAKGRGVIIPHYTPPEQLDPVRAEAVLKQYASVKGVTATILELCVSGYVRMYEETHKQLLGSKKTYELELVKDAEGVTDERHAVLEMLFGKAPKIGARVNLSSKDNKFYAEVPKITYIAEKNIVREGYFSNSPKRVMGVYMGIGGTVALLGIVALVFPLTLYLPLWHFGAGIIIAGIIMFVFGIFMPGLTQKGAEAKEHLKGLKMYMELAEEDRIKMLQSPDTAEKVTVDPSDTKQLVKLYEKLLPYAMVLGVEDEWVKRLSEMYETPPDWYSGSSAFNAGVFVGAMSGFSTASQSSFAPPSSASGAGGSGGGGGGGGGGGW